MGGVNCSSCTTRDLENEMQTGRLGTNGANLEGSQGPRNQNSAIATNQNDRRGTQGSAVQTKKQVELQNSGTKKDVTFNSRQLIPILKLPKEEVVDNRYYENAGFSSEPISTDGISDEDQDETIMIDECTIRAIIKFQALVRGYLTRKLIYEHLQQIVHESGEDLNSECQDQEDDFEEEQHQGSAYKENGRKLVPVREVECEEEDCQSQVGSAQKLLGPPADFEVGEFKFENGAVYNGQWKNSQRHGTGVQLWPDGARYEGEWRDNQAHGRGTFFHVDGDVFEGEWAFDKANGYGTYYNANGSKYEGSWIDDLQDGQGKETWQDQSTYQGLYKRGQKHGEGTYVWSDGSVYTGFWSGNKIQGKGIYRWADGRVYQGDWLDNKMHGKGKLIWANGRSYEGEFQNDMKHGTGTYCWVDGQKYQGSWMAGKQHGEGVHTSVEGKSRRGTWVNGKREQWHGDVVMERNQK